MKLYYESYVVASFWPVYKGPSIKLIIGNYELLGICLSSSTQFTSTNKTGEYNIT